MEERQHAHLVKLMRLAEFTLANSIEDVAAGRCTAEDRRVLAGGLDQLVTALRDADTPVVVDSEVRES